MKILTQVEPRQGYEIPTYRTNPNRDTVELEPVVIASLVLGLAVGLVAWAWMMWRLASKAGYGGISRWLWVITLAFPFTTGLSLMAFVLLPWPIQKQLKTLPKPNDIDEELNRLKRGL
jgi:TRAP-type C4-dicarboxylate transport system permease small subunit